MGLCLSCLKPEVDDGGYDERTSLLNDSRYADEEYQNALLRQQQRQSELSVIVNDLSENLIDVSTFLTSNGDGSRAATPQVIENFASEEDFDQTSPALPSAGLETKEKHYPKVWSVEEKIQLLRDVAEENLKCELVAPKDALYVEL